MSDADLPEMITHAVIEATQDYVKPGLISYETDALYEEVQDAVTLAIAQHHAPLGR